MPSPVGRWKTIDDESGKARSIVEITDTGTELQGRVVEIFYEPGDKTDPICELCDGALKDKPVIGMTFLWGLMRDGDPKDATWASGSVLDPKNGKIYNAKLSLIEGGQKLRMRGFIGTPLFGRTQVWLREVN